MGAPSRRVRTICDGLLKSIATENQGARGQRGVASVGCSDKGWPITHGKRGFVVKPANVQRQGLPSMDPPSVLPAALAADSGSDDYELSDKEESSDPEEYEDWDSDVEEGLAATCLFCGTTGPVRRVVDHLRTDHGFVSGEWLRAGTCAHLWSLSPRRGSVGVRGLGMGLERPWCEGLSGGRVWCCGARRHGGFADGGPEHPPPPITL
jgi:hypothetical protein